MAEKVVGKVKVAEQDHVEEKTDGNREQNADGLVLPGQQESNPETTFTLFPRLLTELCSGWNFVSRYPTSRLDGGIRGGLGRRGGRRIA